MKIRIVIAICICVFLLMAQTESHRKAGTEDKTPPSAEGVSENKALRAELLKMEKEDQEIRKRLVSTDYHDAAAISEGRKIDSRNTERMREIVREFGWPTKSLVGSDGSQAAWLIIQHSPDLEFQKKCLELMKSAAEGEVAPVDIAYLTDRILMYEGRKQIYGTQLRIENGHHILYPIEDEKNVNARRKSIGLTSIEAYLERFRSHAEGRILVIFSGKDYVSLKGGGSHPTGYFLSELATPLKSLLAAGYDIECANPPGTAPVMDRTSDTRQFFASEQAYHEAKKLAGRPDIQNPRKLSSLSESELALFDGVFLPGGHAPMEDLYRDPQLGAILRYFHERGKPTALICHAPVALLSAREGEDWIYRDYRMTAFSNAEEQEAEKSGSLGGSLSFYIGDALSAAGARLSYGTQLWQSHVMWDRELITGQNPGSGEDFAATFLEALTAEKLRNKSLNSWPSAGKSMTGGELYNASLSQCTWKDGYTTLWIGKRQEAFPEKEFLSRLTSHLNHARSAFAAHGLRGYVIYPTDNYEIAYANWPDRESARRGLHSPAGKKAVEDGDSFMDPVLFKEAARQPVWLTE